MSQQSTGGTEEPSTPDVRDVFQGLLSAEDAEDTQSRETPPAAAAEATPESEESVEPEHAAPEDESESDEESDEDPAPQPRSRRLKIGDEELEVTEDEAYKGYLRQQDYTRKTQLTAEERKALAAEKERVTADRQRYVESLGLVEKALRVEEPNWDKLEKELPPADFAKAHAAYRIHQDRVRAIAEERTREAQKVADDQLAAQHAFVEKERASLYEALPAWKDKAVREKERTAMKEFALSRGFTKEQLDGIQDARTMVMLRDAWKHNEAQKARPAIRARVDAIRAATPGSSMSQRKPITAQQKAMKRLAKTGRVDDAAAVFLHHLDKE